MQYQLQLRCYTIMAIRSSRNANSEQQHENAMLRTDKVGEVQHDNIDDSPKKDETISRLEIDELDENDDVHVNITISRKAYAALEKYTKELNQREPGNHRPFTIEEVLDEEIILLFTNESNKE